MNYKTKTLFIIYIFILISTALHSKEDNLYTKVSQLIFASYDIKEEKKMIKQVKSGIGGIQIKYGDYSFKETQKVISRLYKTSKIPPFISIDYEGGSVYIHQTHNLLNLPSNWAIGKAGDLENTTRLFYLIGLELKKAGINTIFAPDVDVNTNPKNPIINIRAFSDNKDVVFKTAEAALKGMNASRIIHCLKHFPGHGMTDTDSHKVLPVTDIDAIELYETHIYPFKELINKYDIDMVMLSHVLYKNIDPNYPASMSEIIINKILREQLNFKGVIITDSLDMKAISDNYSIEKAAITAIKNGADMVLTGTYNPDKIKKALIKAIKEKKLSLKRINEAYIKIIELKNKYELKKFQILDYKFKNTYYEIANTITKESITVLKDSTKNIPLSREKKIFAVFLTPQRFSDSAIKFYTDLKNRGYDIEFVNINYIKNINIKKLQKNIKDSDMLIIGNYSWPYISNYQKKLIKELTEYSKNKILINFLNPYDSEILKDYFDTVIETYGINIFSINALTEKIIKKDNKFKN